MRLKWKLLFLGLSCLLSAAVTGCGGLNASQGISPASLLFLKAEPQPDNPAGALPGEEPAKEMARL